MSAPRNEQLESLLRVIDDWPCERAGAAVVLPDGETIRHGITEAPFALASVTKLLTASGVLLACEEGTVALDDRVGEDGHSVEDLLAHSSGIGPNGRRLSGAQQRRIYSNAGYDLLGDHVSANAEMSFAAYLSEGVFAPLGMLTAALTGPPAHGAIASVDDLVNWVTRLPQLLAPETLDVMITPHVPDLAGVLPGYGRQTNNTWGRGPEIRSTKAPHWTGSRNSPSTWGHFGQSGTFLWSDPRSAVSLVVLTDRRFGEWALPLWPALSDAVLACVAD